MLSMTPQISIMTTQFGSVVSDFHSTVLVWGSWHSLMKTELGKRYKEFLKRQRILICGAEPVD